MRCTSCTNRRPRREACPLSSSMVRRRWRGSGVEAGGGGQGRQGGRGRWQGTGLGGGGAGITCVCAIRQSVVWRFSLGACVITGQAAHVEMREPPSDTCSRDSMHYTRRTRVPTHMAFPVLSQPTRQANWTVCVAATTRPCSSRRSRRYILACLSAYLFILIVCVLLEESYARVDCG